MSSDVQPLVTVSRRRADLNCLPTEIKTHIARLCAEQDDRLREEREALRQRYIQIAPRQLCDGIYGSLTRPSSLGCLFRTSKEWSTIAAPFRFVVGHPLRSDTSDTFTDPYSLKVLRAHVLKTEQFFYETVHTGGQYYHSLDLTTCLLMPRAFLDVLVKLASVLPILSNLRNIIMPDYGGAFEVGELEGSSGFSKYAIERTRIAIRNLFAQAASIKLGPVISSVATSRDLATIDRFSNLLSLSLDIEGGILPDMMKLLPSMPALRSLVLDLRGDMEEVDDACEAALQILKSDIASHGTAPTPTLQQLRFKFADFSPGVMTLVSLFRRSLVQLSLFARKTAFDAENGWAFEDDFPNLELLALGGDVRAFTCLIERLNQKLFPRLEEVQYLPSTFADPELPPVIAPDFGRPLRRIVTYNTRGPLELDFNLDIKCNELVMQPRLHPDLLDYAYTPSLSDCRHGAPAVDRTLQHGRDWYNRALLHKDDASMVALAKALSNLELERIAHAV